MFTPQASTTRVYSSMTDFQRDAAQLAPYGWVAANVLPQQETNGCLLACLLIVGILLTPFCIGVLILLLLPTAFSRSVTVTYFYNPDARPVVALPPGAYPAHPVMPPVSSVERTASASPWRMLYDRVLAPFDTLIARGIPNDDLRLSIYILVSVLAICGMIVMSLLIRAAYAGAL